MKDEVLIQPTHRVGYDHAIRNAGVRLIEVATRAELERAISERTAMLFFLNAAGRRARSVTRSLSRSARNTTCRR